MSWPWSSSKETHSKLDDERERIIDHERSPMLVSSGASEEGASNGDSDSIPHAGLALSVISDVLEAEFRIHSHAGDQANNIYRKWGSSDRQHHTYHSVGKSFPDGLNELLDPSKLPFLKRSDASATREKSRLYTLILNKLQTFASSFTTYEYSLINQSVFRRLFGLAEAARPKTDPSGRVRMADWVPSREERYAQEVDQFSWSFKKDVQFGEPIIDLDRSLKYDGIRETKEQRRKRLAKMWLYRYFPIFEWIQWVTWRSLLRDFVAGTTVACTLIPQAMAYAGLANLDPVFGLYSAFFPQMVYAILGTARQAALGPVAVVSLLVGSATSLVDYKKDKAGALAIAIMLSFGSGLLNFGMGVLRLGWITDFLSHPVLIGFMIGAGLNIGVGQAKDIFGISVPSDISNGPTYAHLGYQLAHLNETKWQTFCFGAAAFVLLFVIRKINRRYKTLIPGPLIAVVFFTGMSYRFQLDQKKELAVVGTVPSGLPTGFNPIGSLPASVSGSSLIGSMISVALIGYMETIAIGKQFARKNGYKIDPSQELIAVGASNFLGSFLQAYPICVSFSRTAINAAAGATSNVTKFVSAMWVAFALLFLTPLVFWLPKPVLSAIITMAVMELMDFEAAMHIFHFKKWDFLTLFGCFIAVFFGGVELGVGVGIGFSLILVVIRMSFFPSMHRLSRVMGTETYENHSSPLSNWAVEQPGVLIVSLRTPLYFFNRERLREHVHKSEKEAREHGGLKVVILDFTSCPDVDSDGTMTLREIYNELRERGRVLLFAGVSEEVKTFLDRADLRMVVGPQNFLPNVPTAVHHAIHGSKDGTRILGVPPQGAVGSQHIIVFREPPKQQISTSSDRPRAGDVETVVVDPQYQQGGGI